MAGVVEEAVALADRAGTMSAVSVREAAAAQKRKAGALDYYAASMTSMFLLFGCMFGAFSFVEERTTQTMQRMMVSPTARSSIVGGKLFAVILLGLGQFAVLYVFTSLVLDAHWGDPVGVWSVAIAELIATAGLAAVIAGVARTRRGVGGIAPVVVQIMALIGGAFFVVTIFPGWLQPIRYFSVVGLAMDGFVALQNGASPAAVLDDVAALVAMGLAFFVAGVFLLRSDR